MYAYMRFKEYPAHIVIWRKADHFLHVCVWDIEKCVGGLKIRLNILEHVCKFSYRKFLAVAQITWTTRNLDFQFTVALRWKVVNISEIFHLFFLHFMHTRVLGSLLSAFLYFLIIAFAHFTNFQYAAIKIAIKKFQYFFERGRMRVVSLNHTPHCLITFFSLFLYIFCLFYR